MDATALYAYRYQNTYMIYVDHYDGYPSGRGTSLVRSIPTEPVEFDAWLWEARELNARIVEKLKHTDSSDNLGCYRRPSSEAPVNDVNIRWVYTIDLDRLVFSVDGTAHFKLNNIPRREDGEEWIRYLGQDGVGWRCLKPSTPKSHIADVELYPDLPEMSGVASRTGDNFDRFHYHCLGATLVDPGDLLRDCSQTEIASQAIAVTLVKAVVGHSYGRLCDACQYEPSDRRLQRLAAYLLRASAPNFLQLHLASDPVMESPSQEVESTDKEEDQEKEHNREPGVLYWFRGCLILLSNRLEFETHLKANIARVVTHIKAKRLESCTALIWSIRHVVIVRVFNDRVVHTPALPVLPAFGADDDAFAASISLMSHFLRPLCAEESPASDVVHVKSDSSCPVGPRNPPGIPGVSSIDRVSLPTDIILEVMKFSDIQTYNTVFSRLTWATRTAWMNRPRIGPYAIYGIVSSSSSDDTETISNTFNSIIPRPVPSTCSSTSSISTSASLNSSSSLSSSSDATLLAHTETGSSILLSLIYEGHPYLGNCALSSLFMCPCDAMCAVTRVVLRWPRDVSPDLKERERDEGMDGMGLDDLERCGLVLSFV
ncbi:hypothetical protein ACEPAH_9268 [Sanghuangporus vaninii]